MDSCKNPSRTLVKVLLNLILAILFTCNGAPVITRRTLVAWASNDFYETYVFPALVYTMVRLVDYMGKSTIKLTPALDLLRTSQRKLKCRFRFLVKYHLQVGR